MRLAGQRVRRHRYSRILKTSTSNLRTSNPNLRISNLNLRTSNLKAPNPSMSSPAPIAHSTWTRDTQIPVDTFRVNRAPFRMETTRIPNDCLHQEQDWLDLEPRFARSDTTLNKVRGRIRDKPPQTETIAVTSCTLYFVHIVHACSRSYEQMYARCFTDSTYFLVIANKLVYFRYLIVIRNSPGGR